MLDVSSKPTGNADADVKTWPWNPLSTIAILIGVIIIAQILIYVPLVLLGVDITNLGLSANYLLAMVNSIVPLGLLSWFASRRNLDERDFGWRWGSKLPWGLIFKSLGIYLIASLALNMIVAALFPGADLSAEQDLGLNEPNNILSHLTLFILLVGVTPFSEELLFRGFLFNSLNKRIAWVPAAITSSILFGLAHLQLNVGLDTAVLGFMSARLFYLTDSILPSIVLHGIKNLIAFTLLFIMPLL